MINLSLDELKLIAQNRDISDYENRSKMELVKALSEATPKLGIRIIKKNLEEIRNDFNELRHKFFKKEINNYRIAFYDIKNYKHLSVSEIKEVRKNLSELRKSLKFKKFHGGVDSVDYDDFDNYDDDNFDFVDDDEYKKNWSIRALFKEFERDYYKPIRTDDGFAGRKNNYIEYKSKGDRYENLYPDEYLKIIRLCLRDLINNHKPPDDDNDDTDRAEQKIQLVM